MAIFSGLMITDHDFSEYDSDSELLDLTVNELINRFRFCFRDSGFDKLAKVLTARENRMEELIRELESELEKMNREKKEAEKEYENWKVETLSRVSDLEKEVEELEKEKQACEMVSCKRCEKMELEKQAVETNESDSQEKRLDSGPALEGNGKNLEKTIVIIDSDDDEDGSKGDLDGKETASDVNPQQKSSQNVVKRKIDASSTVSENSSSEETNMDENSNGDGDGLRFKLQKITHDESTENLGSTSIQNEKGTIAQSSINKSLLDLSSDESSSSSSSDSEDEKDDRNWEYELDVFASLTIDNELCLKAICALYRRNCFSSANYAKRISAIAKFLTGGDPQGMLKKSVSELVEFDGRALDDCKAIARSHTKQLFNLYKSKDPLFQP